MGRNITMDIQCIPDSYEKHKVLKDIVIYNEERNKLLIIVAGKETPEELAKYTEMVVGTSSRMKEPFSEHEIVFIESPFEDTTGSPTYTHIDCVRSAFRYIKSINPTNIYIPYTDYVMDVLAENVGGMDALCAMITDELGSIFDYKVRKTITRQDLTIPLQVSEFEYNITSKYIFIDGIKTISNFKNSIYKDTVKKIRNAVIKIQYINDYTAGFSGKEYINAIHNNPYIGLENVIVTLPLLRSGLIDELTNQRLSEELKEKLFETGEVELFGYKIKYEILEYPEHIVLRYPNKTKYCSIEAVKTIDGAEVDTKTFNHVERDEAFKRVYTYILVNTKITKILEE